MQFGLCTATLALLLASTTAAAANLVVNGSFEDSVQAPGTFGVYAALPGWTGDPDIELRNAFAGDAFEGVNFVELDSFGNSSMSQTLVGTGLVRLTFMYSTRATPGTAAGSSRIGFSLGTLSGTVLEDDAGAAAHDWRTFSALADLGDSGSAVLRFEALGLSDQFGGSLDAVSVSPVPLPGALALLAPALGLLRYRRRRA